jgi:uncharacterized hydrophobic protein (TIGR00271 family)
MEKQGQSWRDWIAEQLDIDDAHKVSLYLDVAQGAALLKLNYWLELVCAAGIATLGLALNSPAVIIGAMLISPLMSPILSMGLSLATGDFILAVRSFTNLFLSSLLAILLATTLVYLLPFKEITNEIAARTNPNILDLVVALFSGAIGSISTCKPMRGIINSIPGVAIAVALMPPLCVVGHGIGIGISHSFADGLRVGIGGGLLFFTNIVAITFTAMLVFLAINIDTNDVKEKVREWHQNDRESQVIQQFLSNNNILQRLRPIGSLQGRLIMVLSIILLVMLPLNKSIERLNREVAARNEENRIRRIVRDVWNRQIAQDVDGKPRSYLNQLNIQRRENQIILNMNAFTSKPLTFNERQSYINQVAKLLNRPEENILLNLVEIPTSDFQTQVREFVNPELTLEQALSSLINTIDNNINSISFPGAQKLVDYRIITNKNLGVKIEVIYLAEERMSQDAELLISRAYAQSIPLQQVDVELEFLDGSFMPLPIDVDMTNDTKAKLDRLATTLQQFPNLALEIYLPQSQSYSQQVKVITDYLNGNYQLGIDRVLFRSGINSGVKLTLK